MDGSKSSSPQLRFQNRVRKNNYQTAAAKYNAAQYRSLLAKLKKDPEADLIALLSTDYSKRLQSFKTYASTPITTSHLCTARKDLRSKFCIDDPIIPYELSHELSFPDENLPKFLIELFNQSEVVFGANSTSCIVLKASPTLAIKITYSELQTEYSALSFIQEHVPEFPAPKPLGLVQYGKFQVLFMTFVAGVTLEDAWPQLDCDEKVAIKNQLENHISKLRLLPRLENQPLGGVRGEGCKDIRRIIRTASQPIRNEKEFRDFVFTGASSALLYTSLLQTLLPDVADNCVFTHGDLRPANIIVEPDDGGKWKIAAIVDWEASGFYPEYWEGIKMTNNLTPRDTFDWYKYLPTSISFQKYTVEWLVDRLWDPLMENS